MGPSRPVRGRRYLNAGLAVLGFVLVCALLNAALPFPEIGVVASHLRYFKKHRNEFDTLFVGSSLTHHQISPAVFDRIMLDGGHATRGFNFGVNGMLVAEMSYVLERILETKPAHLKWVFIELDELDTRPFAGAAGSRRDIYWRDWNRTGLLVKKLLGGERDLQPTMLETQPSEFGGTDGQTRTWQRLLFQVSLFGKNITNVSRRLDLAWWGSHFWKPEKMPDDLGPGGNGYAPLHLDLPEEKKIAYQYQMDRVRGDQTSRFVSPATAQAYREMARKIRRAGATPIFLGMPLFSRVRLEFPPEAGVDGMVMSFNDEKAYPELYRIEVHADEIHLNDQGAEALTTLMARRLSQLLNEQKVQ